MKGRLSIAAVLLLLCWHAHAADMSAVTNRLQKKKELIKDLSTQLLANYAELQKSKSNNSATAETWFGFSGDFAVQNKSLDACGTELPSAWNPVCDRTLGGDTKGCECKGQKKVDAITVKSIDPNKDSNARRNIGNHAGFAAGKKMYDAYKSAAAKQDYENKWMYFGAVDGSYSIFPGILWPRDNSQSKCGGMWDPRMRPWYLSAANGPKNVIFILDVSGSMSQKNRLELMKKAASKMIDSLSFVDFMAVVYFSTEAKVLEGLTFMAPAYAGFRELFKSKIANLEAGGGTNYEAALRKAFQLADTNYNANYDSGCQTAFVFLTDGEQTEGSSDYNAVVSERAEKSLQRSETFIVIGLGKDVESGTPKEKLQEMACKGKGIFQSVPDLDETGDVAREKAEYNILQALSLFSTYFTTKNTVLKRDVVTYSEIFGSSWDGVSSGMEVTTASQAVYDKTDPNRWKFLGVMGIDVTVCNLEDEILKANPSIQDIPALPEETVVPGCKCAESYTYTPTGGSERTYTGGVCQTDGWPVPWCATGSCGIPADTISTGYWADCKPFGVRAELEASLKRVSMEECKKTDLDACELEAIRPAGKKCAATSGCADLSTQSTLESHNYRDKVPGFDMTNEMGWAANLDGSYDSTQWSMSSEGCDQCKNTDMKPQCALPPECGLGVQVPLRTDVADGSAILGPTRWPCLALAALIVPLHALLV